jgi:two-component system cell cycle sensor histidine kinase/response regulator CckA
VNQTILIVNDDADQRELLATVLTLAGAIVHQAGDGAEAFAAALDLEPDAIVTDVNMPRMDGIALCRAVRADADLRDVPVLLVSAISRDSAAAAEGFAAGADDYLELPYEPMRLVAKVARLAQRRSAERTLRHSEAELRALFAGLSDVVLVLDVDGTYIRVAPTRTRMLYRPSAELVGSTLHDVFPAEQADLYLREIRRALTSGVPREFEYTVQIDGEDVWFDATLSPTPDHVVFWVARDVTKRRQAEAALQQSEARMRLLVDSTAEGIIGIDLEGRCTTCNRAAVEMLGYESAADVLGKPMHPLVHHTRADGTPNPLDHCAIMHSLRDGVAVHVDDEVFRRRDGGAFPVAYHASPVRGDGAITGCVVTFLDTTDQRLLQEKLIQSQKMEAVGRLGAGIAHDFNNLLTAIIGFSELVIQALPVGCPPREDAEQIRQAGERAGILTRQLLAFSRRQVLKPVLLDLNAVVERTEAILKRVIGEDINLHTVLPCGLSLVRADLGQLEQVLMNLAVNAKDAMPGGGTLTIETAEVDLDRSYDSLRAPVEAGRYMMAAVTDTGHGMDEYVRAHLFEPFFTTKDPGHGTGLGLSTVHDIVRQCGGAIWVDSEVGRGTTFKIYLPCVGGDHAHSAMPAGAGQPNPRGTETLLLVEDAPHVRALAQQILQRAGYTVLVAINGEEAVRVAARHQHVLDLVLTDVVMPMMGGRAAADHIRGPHPESRVIYMSGYPDSSIVHQGVLNPGVAFLEKPFTPGGLLRKVRDVLDGPR